MPKIVLAPEILHTGFDSWFDPASPAALACPWAVAGMFLDARFQSRSRRQGDLSPGRPGQPCWRHARRRTVSEASRSVAIGRPGELPRSHHNQSGELLPSWRTPTPLGGRQSRQPTSPAPCGPILRQVLHRLCHHATTTGFRCCHPGHSCRDVLEDLGRSGEAGESLACN